MTNKKIAVFANGWSNEFIEQILEGLRSEAKKDNVDIFVFLTYSSWGDSRESCKSQLNIFHLPKPSDFDGGIILTNTFNYSDEEERVCALFKDQGIPLISTGVRIEGLPFLGNSNYKGIFELSNHILDEHNVKKVVYVSGLADSAENTERKQALVDALHNHDLDLDDVIDGDYSFYGGYHGVENWLEKNDELPDAFVCANDHMAIGVCNALEDKGYSVPDDVIVTGYDNVCEAKRNFPMIASVARRADEMGVDLYNELKKQMENPDPSFEKVYDTVFVPAESCGCTPSKEQYDFRLNKLKSSYYDKAYADLTSMFYQNIRFALAKVENPEEFFEVAKGWFDELTSIGQEYWICIEPAFFELNDDMYPKRIRGYSKNMNVIIQRTKKGFVAPYSFDSKEVVPHYKKAENESNTYMIVPLCYMEYIIGYGIIKNKGDMLYDLSLHTWVSNMNTLFINIRQYIFAQQNNRKLKEIYMTDFLTGIYNRTGCENVLYGRIKENMEEGFSTILLFADINRMKVINDKYGHLNGDLAIKATADALKYTLEDNWLLGRYGGDEYIAVGLWDEKDDPKLLCKNLEKEMFNYTESLNLSFELSSSVGYTVITKDSIGEIEDFIQRADECMYEAKQEAHRRMDARIVNED